MDGKGDVCHLDATAEMEEGCCCLTPGNSILLPFKVFPCIETVKEYTRLREGGWSDSDSTTVYGVIFLFLLCLPIPNRVSRAKNMFRV